MSNPYDAPQSDLRTSKPKVVYVDKFNGKLAFWSGLAIGMVLFALFVPMIQTDRDPPRTFVGEILRYTVLAMISIGLGLILGSISGTPMQEPALDKEQEERPSVEPNH